jgi:LysM repeat protein/serine/threonine protein phosphatase PrpC
MKVAFSSKTEVGSHSINSDAIGDLVTKNGHVFVVSEAFPNSDEGAFVSRLTVQSILEYFQSETFDNVYIGLNHSFQYANDQVYRAIKKDEKLTGIFSNAAVVLVRPEGAYYGTIGKSKVYLKSGESFLTLTKDSQDIEITSYNSSSKTSIPAAIGNTPSVFPTIANEPILGKRGDLIVLSTSPLSSFLQKKEVYETIQYIDFQTTISIILSNSKKSVKQGNLTLSILAVTEGNEKISYTSNEVNPSNFSKPEKKSWITLLKNGELDRKTTIKLGAIILSVFILIWFSLRQPKDDSNMTLEEVEMQEKADTIELHNDIEDLIKEEKSKKEVEVEEEEEEEKTMEEEMDSLVENTEKTEAIKTEEKTSPATTNVNEAKSTPKQGSKIHVVKPGDNLGRIAEKYHVKMDIIRKANNLKNDQINIDQELIIPGN